MTRRTRLLILLLILPTIAARADDGAASIAAGGLVVMKREPRVVMAKEVLQISAKKVIVDYDFRNDSDEDITTEVAFPIPDYDFSLDREGSKQGFEDFQLWIDGSPARYQVEARAFVKDKDYTKLLTDMHVDVGSYGRGPLLKEVNGHLRAMDKSQDIDRLTPAQRDQLGKVGLIAQDSDDEPQWHVKKKYYWEQTFPAHKSVHVRHEYTPVLGSENSVAYGLGSTPNPAMVKEIDSFCLDDRLAEQAAGDRQ